MSMRIRNLVELINPSTKQLWYELLSREPGERLLIRKPSFVPEGYDISYWRKKGKVLKIKTPGSEEMNRTKLNFLDYCKKALEMKEPPRHRKGIEFGKNVISIVNSFDARNKFESYMRGLIDVFKPNILYGKNDQFRCAIPSSSEKEVFYEGKIVRARIRHNLEFYNLPVYYPEAGGIDFYGKTTGISIKCDCEDTRYYDERLICKAKALGLLLAQEHFFESTKGRGYIPDDASIVPKPTMIGRKILDSLDRTYVINSHENERGISETEKDIAFITSMYHIGVDKCLTL